METNVLDALPEFLETIGLTEEPMGSHFTDNCPETGFSPPPMDMPTIEKERNNAIDWPAIFGNFSCALGNIWRARRKKTAAWFSAEQFGCPGAAFWLVLKTHFLKPKHGPLSAKKLIAVKKPGEN